jgi:hypothetical protein
MVSILVAYALAAITSISLPMNASFDAGLANASKHICPGKGYGAYPASVQVLLLPSVYEPHHVRFQCSVQSVSSSSLALGFRDQSLVQTVGLP